ncbi:FxsA family protein [Candidatus Pelagibacter bacterium]|nr:FxsA family protein [Candidatus Pelagibacter bacterium]MDA9624949.1 FxsA family protein [Candidatus Pelagibacter bacterium]
MNSIFFLLIGLPALEVFLMIKIGGKIGALNTVLLIFLTAVIGLYFAKLQGIRTIQNGLKNLYQNKTPIYEMISGASIAFAAILLIVPGFFTDTIGFLLLVPFTRNVLINFFIHKDKVNTNKENNKTLDGEIVEDKKDEL